MTISKVRLLSIVAVIVLFVLSWYTLIEESVSNSIKYNEYLNIARDKAKYEMYDDALANYQQALGMKDTLELRLEIAQFYYDYKQMDSYVGYCEGIMNDYPYDAAGYEKSVEYFKSVSDFEHCYTLLNTAKKRKVESEYLNKTYNELAYKFELTYKKFENVGIFSGGYCAVKKNDGYWGFVDVKGNTSISFKYVDVDNFNAQGLAAVKNQEDKFVLVNTSGVVKHVDIDKKAIEDCGLLAEDLMPVKYNGKYHYCDIDFKEKFGNYDYAGAFNQGVAAVKEGENWFVIKNKGEKVSDATYSDIKVDGKGIAFRNGIAFAKKNDKYIMIDTNCKQIGSLTFDDACVFASEQPAAVKSGDKWGFVNTNGELVVKYTYGNAKSFINGFAAVAENNRWGYIIVEDYSLKIEYSFDEALDFTNAGTTIVKSDGNWSFLKLYRLSN